MFPWMSISTYWPGITIFEEKSFTLTMPSFIFNLKSSLTSILEATMVSDPPSAVDVCGMLILKLATLTLHIKFYIVREAYLVAG